MPVGFSIRVETIFHTFEIMQFSYCTITGKIIVNFAQVIREVTKIPESFNQIFNIRQKRDRSIKLGKMPFWGFQGQKW